MDISSLLSSLSEDDIQKLKNTASQIFGESTSREETENKQTDFSKNSPFAGFNGIASEVDNVKQKMTVTVLVFGRETSMDLEFSQVEKV